MSDVTIFIACGAAVLLGTTSIAVDNTPMAICAAAFWLGIIILGEDK